MPRTQSPEIVAAKTVADGLPDRADVVETLSSCPLCSGTSFRPLSTPGHWIGEEFFSRSARTSGLQRCRSCSLTFVNPRPMPALLNAFYGSNNYVCHGADAGSTTTAQFLLDCVARHGPYQGHRFLDFGCGGGFLLRAALGDSWDAFGFDVGKCAIAACNSQGLTATAEIAELASLTFDVVFLNHVFEHIAQPHAVLSQCRRVLHKKGKLFVVVPNLAGLRARLSFPFLSRQFNVDERHRAFPIHLFYFTPRTLSQTLEKHGFRVKAVETFGLGLDELINRRDDQSDVPNGELGTPGTRKRSALRQIVKRSFFGACLGENLMAVAQPI